MNKFEIPGTEYSQQAECAVANKASNVCRFTICNQVGKYAYTAALLATNVHPS